MFDFGSPRDWKRFLLGVVCGLCAVLTTTALSIQLGAVSLEESEGLYGIAYHLIALGKSWKNTTAVGLVLFIALWYIYWKIASHKLVFLPSAGVLSFFFSVFLVVGRSYELCDSWYLILANWHYRFLGLVMLLGYWVFFYGILMSFFLWLDQYAPKERQWQPLTKKQFALAYGGCFAVILLFWLPYLIICYPGSVSTDGINQLGQAIGEAPASNGHPWFSTLLMGMFAQGRNWEQGIFLYVLLHSVVCAAAFAGICMQLLHLTKSWIWPVAALAFYGIVPTWGGYAQTYIKDTMFYGVFAGFFLCVVMVVQQRGQCRWGVWVGLFLLGLLSALLRNNGFYVAIPTLLCMAAAIGPRRVCILLLSCAVGIFGLYWGWNQLLPVFGVEAGSIREMLSLPFQQTARYVRSYHDELTEDEIQAIENVLDYESIFTNYDPRVSDPVKNTYHGDSEALKEYFKVWLRCGLRHPEVYIDATLNSVFGYFLPGYRYGSYGGNYFLMEKPKYGVEVEFAHPTQVNALDQYSRLWSQTPGLLLFNAPGAHSWLLMLCTTVLLRKKKWMALLATLPIWLTLGICCVSPVNGLVRYMLPVMACMPLLLGFTWQALVGSGKKQPVSQAQEDHPAE